MTSEEILEALAKPTVPVEVAGKILGIGRNGVYAAAKRGDIDIMKMGKRVLVLSAPLKRKLGLEAA
jgi:hypothetical protein